MYVGQNRDEIMFFSKIIRQDDVVIEFDTLCMYTSPFDGSVDGFYNKDKTIYRNELGDLSPNELWPQYKRRLIRILLSGGLDKHLEYL